MPRSKIRIMISSRCDTEFPASSAKNGKSLTEWRRKIKKTIQEQMLFGQLAFEVWINEDAPPSAHDSDSWETCLAQVRDCDVLLVLATGSAGWGKDSSSIGICHAEYMEGLNTAPGKVYVIRLENSGKSKSDDTQRNKRFQKYLEDQSGFRGELVKTGPELENRVLTTLNEAVKSLVWRGVREASASRFDKGAALDWNRLDYRERALKMCEVLTSCMYVHGTKLESNLVSRKVNGVEVVFQLHAIPASIGIATAREMVGRPFLLDHKLAPYLKKYAGPVHLIACHRNATEGQAISLLGFPDATVVNGSFGVYVADPIQKVQFVFLSNCRDESNLRHQQQRFFEWLEQTGEGLLLARRAQSRKRIVKAVAEELK